MKRLGIVCIYDKEGKVDRYLEYLLYDLKKVINDLYLVVNGKLCENDYKKLQNITDKIYVRENRGFDAGAYKDAILNWIGRDRLVEYDEMVLCNDTFYGPFDSFETIFDEMQRKKKDFWGLKFVESKFLSHLQSYFLVFEKTVLKDPFFIDYMESHIDEETEDILEVYASFENGLFYALTSRGYQYAAYGNAYNYDVYLSPNFCVREEKLPIIKKKAFAKKYLHKENLMDVLKYVAEKYDISMIKENAVRLYGCDLAFDKLQTYKISKEDLAGYVMGGTSVEERQILDFCRPLDEIYFYGTGMIARRTGYIFSNRIPMLKGYVVSDDQENVGVFGGLPVYHVGEIKNTKSIGIIVALNRNNSEKVKENVKDFENVLFLFSEMNC